MRRFAPAAVALVATAALVAGLLSVQDAITPPAPSTAVEGAAFAFRWPADTVYRYRLELTGEKTVRAAPAELTGRLDMATHLELRSYGRHEGRYRLGLRFVDIERHALNLLGTDALPDRATVAAVFDGREAIVDVDPSGAVAGLRFAADDPTLFKHLAQLVVGEMQLVLEPGAVTWEAFEDTQHGRAVTDYEVVASDDSGIDLGRHRFDYARLDGAPHGAQVQVDARYEARVARSGHTVRLVGTERISGGETVQITGRIDLELESIGVATDGRTAPAVAAATETRTLDTWPVSEEARRMQLVSRAGDMTVDRMVGDLQRFGPGGEMPHHSRWAWQATGRLLLEPGGADALARAVVSDDSLGHKGRGLALDLLASVGHAEAQAAMRTALRGVEQDPRYAALLTRAGFVRDPEPETVRLVADAWQRADGLARQSAATTLGAAAGHLYRAGDVDVALGHVRRLETALQGTSDGADRRALLLSLGNAGVPETVATVAAHAGDDDPVIRRAVATALRKTPGLVAEQALGALMVDPDSQVSRAAVRALGRHPLTPAHLTALATQVLDGTLGPATHAPLVDLLVRQGDLDPDARRLLAAAVVRQTGDARLRARLARL